jgi:4-hydroxy-tetrahydrodipicolinate reductase
MPPQAALPIAVSGISGRMGLRIAHLATEAHTCSVVAAIERVDHPDIGKPTGIPGVDPAIVVRSALDPEADPAPRAMIDFSTPDAVPDRLAECLRHNIAFVCGTTGLSDDAEARLHHAATRIPLVHATNFSLGVALMAELTQQVARKLRDEFHVEIVELHHAAKVDAPSGTANTLRDAAQRGLNGGRNVETRHGRRGATGPRPTREIGMHAVRGGSVIGEHTVHFLGPDERIELTHRAGSRDIFATGALIAARWLVGRKPGRYTIADIVASL